MALFSLVKDGTITQDDYSRMPADVRNAVTQLADGGFIDISLESHLVRWCSEKSKELKAFGATTKMRNVAQTVESVKRQPSSEGFFVSGSGQPAARQIGWGDLSRLAAPDHPGQTQLNKELLMHELATFRPRHTRRRVPPFDFERASVSLFSVLKAQPPDHAGAATRHHVVCTGRVCG